MKNLSAILVHPSHLVSPLAGFPRTVWDRTATRPIVAGESGNDFGMNSIIVLKLWRTCRLSRGSGARARDHDFDRDW